MPLFSLSFVLNIFSLSPFLSFFPPPVRLPVSVVMNLSELTLTIFPMVSTFY